MQPSHHPPPRKEHGIPSFVFALIALFACGAILLVLSTAYRTTTNPTIEVTIAPVKVPCTEDFLKECFVIDGVVRDYRIKNFVFQEGYTYVVSLQSQEGDTGSVFVLHNVISKQETTIEEKNAVLREFGRLSEQELELLEVRPPESLIDITGTENKDDTALVLPDTPSSPGGDSPFVALDNRPEHVITQEMSVAPYLVNCGNGYGDECFSVDGAVFYGDIEGFSHQEGYEYVIRVKRTSLPATGVYSYELIEILSQNLVDSFDL